RLVDPVVVRGHLVAPCPLHGARRASHTRRGPDGLFSPHADRGTNRQVDAVGVERDVALDLRDRGVRLVVEPDRVGAPLLVADDRVVGGITLVWAQ
ncbi:MAG: hypothetical protein QOF83_2965, partial [Solirubrobacteraceae bacterium]|nr:hypothetical protein [Solirubrobacteraceae bacterium]